MSFEIDHNDRLTDHNVLNHVYSRFSDKKEIAKGRQVCKAWKKVIDNKESLVLLMRREKILIELRFHLLATSDHEDYAKNEKLEKIAAVQLRHSPGGALKTLEGIRNPLNRAFAILSYVTAKVDRFLAAKHKLPLEITDGSWKAEPLRLADEPPFIEPMDEGIDYDDYWDGPGASISEDEMTNSDQILKFIASIETKYDLATALQTAKKITSDELRKQTYMQIFEDLFEESKLEEAIEVAQFVRDHTSVFERYPLQVDDYVYMTEAKCTASIRIERALEIVSQINHKGLNEKALDACMRIYAERDLANALTHAEAMENPMEKAIALVAIVHTEMENASKNSRPFPERITSGKWKEKINEAYEEILEEEGPLGIQAPKILKLMSEVELLYDVEAPKKNVETLFNMRDNLFAHRLGNEILLRISDKEAETNLKAAHKTAHSIDAPYKEQACVNFVKRKAQTSIDQAENLAMTYPETYSHGLSHPRFYALIALVETIDDLVDIELKGLFKDINGVYF